MSEQATFSIDRRPTVPGDFDQYDIRETGKKTNVGCISRRSGGDWVASLPRYRAHDDKPNTWVRDGDSLGRGETPEEALSKAVEGRFADESVAIAS